METTNLNNLRPESPKQLQQIIIQLIKVIAVERMYLNKGDADHSFAWRLNIILKLSRQHTIEAIRPVIQEVFSKYDDFVYRIFSFSHVQQELQQANLYFLNNCHDKDLVYKTNVDHLIWGYPIKISQRIETINQNFKRELSRMNSFKKGIHYFKTEKNFAQSAFMMHQTFEQGYRILEQFLCGTVKICHSIKNHQSYVLKTLKEQESMFLVESAIEIRLLDVLEDAYCSARYAQDYKITEKELDQLSQKLGVFIKEIKELFHKEKEIFKSISLKEELNFYSEKSIDASKIEKEKEYNVRSLEFHNSFEMLCRARSMMLLCVTCLQSDVQPPMRVNGFHEDIREVLELAIELLPLREISP
ncbi:hypothetical protein [Cellulophaga baltica]|uniref:HEPN domain-containing protein n=1 Tax=Cellulophaga baltica TaxID=76594 RepID=A0A1G7MBF3_9FLAO|nr:hypothetical protein [Cellulophaga baltica]SDF59128.1 hypothetical protein SAMN04487992_1413 [Cellulophaga baltica]